MWSAIGRLLSEQFAIAEITQRIRLSDGEIHSTWRARYGEHDVFVKCNSRDMLDLFIREAEQLELLARTGTVKVPTVYGVGSDRDVSFLLLEYIPLRPMDGESARQLGEQLARLHQWSEQPQFGLDFDNNFTTSPQPNNWLRRWSHFFSEQRIGWQLLLAAEKGIQYGNSELIIDCAERLLASHHPQPSLLHGDLWPANYGNSHSGPWIFDPACYWGDRECDLALLPDFPALPQHILHGYQSVWPLPTDYLSRQSAYRLYYLLNRANVFGGDWITEAQRAVGALLDPDGPKMQHVKPD
ncbi:fructosamine kinase family protein [Erwinia papayae]|uniref:Fructosamine kinase family protein n=1 Tax=Erwinia papayae TaxID=206499 RepID=A0ABV3N126_9GAMM